ncbi:hypothetical protein RIF29_19462 [Crotalaria pallida]|uniref:MADS-box domain-containing protein n=1 Tax=Crotalaria pallida TaxID=3830 RepID=A0AAN9F211_CROPI
MTNERNLKVTFSKRRSRLFKKASELSTLCGAKVGLVFFSPKGKAFSFGHPNVDTVIDHYLMRAPQHNVRIMQFIEARRNVNVGELNSQITQINGEIEIQKHHNTNMKVKLKETQEQVWWASPIEEMNARQLDCYELALENLKNTIIQGNVVANPPHYSFSCGPSFSNNPPLLLPQPPYPPSLAQLFPIHPSQVMQNPSMMLPNHMIDGAMRMHHLTYNNIGGFETASG